MNRIITRGLGIKNLLLTRGYGLYHLIKRRKDVIRLCSPISRTMRICSGLK